MCGIVGYVGKRRPQELIYSGLKRLEYRGYDSSGIAVLRDIGNGKFATQVIKQSGKLSALRTLWSEIDFNSFQGIGHTRWATHGEANQVNAHPHKVNHITIVHNGIIENHAKIRADLVSIGIKPVSETDSELFGYLVMLERNKGTGLLESVRRSFLKVEGASAFVVMDETLPKVLVVAKRGSPLILGLGKGENFVASDVPAVLESTKTIHYLNDNELAEITDAKVQLINLEGNELSVQPVEIEWTLDSIDKQGYPHYMLKEIFEQPRALTDTLSSWLDLNSGSFRYDSFAIPKGSKFKNSQDLKAYFKNLSYVRLVACGTASHAAQVGQLYLEKWAKVKAVSELASEFRYRDPVIDRTDLGVVVSQSGETADTLAAVKLMKSLGMTVIAICNVRDSSIPRECDAVMYTNAGIEVGVASTKAFTTQMSLLAVLAGLVASAKSMVSSNEENELVHSICSLPSLMKDSLAQAKELEKIALLHKTKSCFLYLGRGPFFPIALEGALKLKEIAYVHAEGYPSGELKHGPIAIVDSSVLVVAISPEGEGTLHSKSVSNFEEVKARRGVLFSIVNCDDKTLKGISESFCEVPLTKNRDLLPILAVIPLQLFAYYLAVMLGTDVDQPRNLAKSVTVE